MKKIGFIGIGKLGLDCAEVMAEKHTVRGYDIYPRSSDTVKVCDIDELVNESEWIFIAVPTPHAEGYDGSVPSSHMTPRDFGHDAVIDAINNINKYAKTSKKVVLISTVLPGTTRKKFVPLLNKKHQFLYNPYLIAMGSVKWDMVNPEMVMIGTEDGTETGDAQQLVEFYDSIMENNPRYVIGTWDECECIKVFYNTFISTKIGLVNMIQDVAMKQGNINVDVVTEALSNSTMRIMGPQYMTAGMGDGGGCHPRDNIALSWLAQKLNLSYDWYESLMVCRENQTEWLADLIINEYQKSNLPIVILGKTFKKETNLVVGSPSILLRNILDEKQIPSIMFDPWIDVNNKAPLDNSSIYFIGTNHDLFLDYNFPNGSIVIDPWRYIQDQENITLIKVGDSNFNK